jgi:rhodanese-related sulfurtransferase
MNRKTIVQTAALIVAGILLALVANAFASRDRKLALVGSYPNALTLPPHENAVLHSQAATETSPPGMTTPSVTSAAPAQTSATSTAATTTTAPTTTTQPTATAAIETVGLNPAAKNPAAKASTPAPPTSTTPTPHPPLPTPTPPDDDPIKRFPPHPDKPYVEIAFADVNWLHGKKVLFLDARRTSVYEQGHISGARPYSVWESDVDDKVRKLFDERGDPQSQSLPIVIYCSGGDCEDSHMLAQKLWGIQFNDIYVYKDGFPDWQQHGGPVHTGANP